MFRGGHPQGRLGEGLEAWRGGGNGQSKEGCKEADRNWTNQLLNGALRRVNYYSSCS